MKDYFKPKTWLIATSLFFIALGLSSAVVYYEFGLKQNVKIVRAGADDNVTGFAWSSNIGWISFNSTDCDIDGDLMYEGANEGGGSTPAPVDCPASGAVDDYGVKIDINAGATLGNFSGYAWSSIVGWIYFGPDADLPTYGLTQANDAPDDPKIWAHYDNATYAVTGWAKILSLGNNGWIKFNGNNPGVSIDPATGDFSGWAWNANDDGSGIGWISFNCDHSSDGTLPPDDINTCGAPGGTSDYKVVANINSAPAVTNMTAPNWDFSSASQYGALNARLGWTFNDSDQGAEEYAYRIIVNTSDSTDNPMFDSGKCLGPNTCEPIGSCDPAMCKMSLGVDQFRLSNSQTYNWNPVTEMPYYNLTYSTAYYWWVQVWDNNNEASALMQYDTSSDTDNNDFNQLTFTTYKHEFPDVSAIYTPQSPSQGERVKFTDTSSIYEGASPTVAVPCDEDKCDWLWTLPSGALFDNSIDDNNQATSTPIIIFDNSGSFDVKLKVTDVDHYYSEITILVNINAKLPDWKEVKPE